MGDGSGLAEAMFGLDGVRVTGVSEADGEVTIEVETIDAFAWCERCGCRAESQDRMWVDVRDLECFGRPTSRCVTSKKQRRTRTPGPQCATTADEDPSTGTPPTSCPPSSPVPAADPLSERQGEAHVRIVLGRLCLVGFWEHIPAELDRWTIRRMHQPLHRLTPRRTEIGEDRLDEQPGQTGALLIVAHRSHHQVPMVIPHPATTAREPLVRSDPNHLTVRHGHDHLTISVFSVRIGPPRNQSGNNLGDLVEPRTRTTKVERLELFNVAVASVANDHASDDSMATVGPFGVQRRPFRFGDERSRPPLARLRFDATSVASSAADSRWMVDQRASSRPFSIREMSAWATPECSASSA